MVACGLSLVTESRDDSLIVVCGFLIAVSCLVVEDGLYGIWASVVVAHGLWRAGSGVLYMNLFDLWHEGSSRTRGRTGILCFARWILNHCTTREAPNLSKLKKSLFTIPSYVEYF